MVVRYKSVAIAVGREGIAATGRIYLHFAMLMLLLLRSSFVSASKSGTTTTTTTTTAAHRYPVLSDEVIFKGGWRSVVRRRVRMDRGNIVDFDVIDQHRASGAVLVVAFCTKTKTFTLVKEYNPGCDRVLHGPAAGLIEEEKHDSEKTAAVFELEEECRLRDGTWHALSNRRTAMDKYVTTEVAPWLVLDARRVEQDDARPLDDEEDIEIVRGVTQDELWTMIRNGEMNLVGGWAFMLALNKLEELGEL